MDNIIKHYLFPSAVIIIIAAVMVIWGLSERIQKDQLDYKFDIEHLAAKSAWNYKELMFAYGLHDCEKLCGDKLEEAIRKNHLTN